MEAFVEDLERSAEKRRPEKFADFRKVLANVGAHPNRRYFILKSIILNNLFGVDIMEEAVEICKLRLFLKLAAQVEPDATARNVGIEPLPDIDFNIRAGNTLVGYATYEAVKTAIKSKFDLDNAMEKIAIKAADLQETFDTSGIARSKATVRFRPNTSRSCGGGLRRWRTNSTVTSRRIWSQEWRQNCSSEMAKIPPAVPLVHRILWNHGQRWVRRDHWQSALC